MKELSHSKKPPFRIIKSTLKSVLQNYPILQPIIENAVLNINQIAVITYQFIKAYCLFLFQNHYELPSINIKFIHDAIKIVSRPKIKSQSKTSHMLFFYDQYFSPLINNHQPCYYNQTYLIAELAKEILTCINTNISTNFNKYIRKYINVCVRDPELVKIDREINNSSEKNQLKNDLKNDMKQLKNALLNNNIDFVTKKYLQWFKINQPLLLPQNMKKHLGYDLKARTSEYLYYSFYINQEIEVSDLMESFHICDCRIN